tara:strand:+ start:128 stop:247 length:120 start_codon:yes stop_codon:yes gene_type:complete
LIIFFKNCFLKKGYCYLHWNWSAWPFKTAITEYIFYTLH